ncbi:helix-turn-helix domain-containing protein [Streptomyces sp. NPDC048258]|uniref:helix-turn-helix domain-containing protein n=1 Tax=Streptomyces sp. NPDC048258 TaxID=3365527 RepID=UPI003724911F
MTQSVETNSELSLPSPEERRRLREAADLTHEQVAAAVGVTVTTVRSWETGRTEPRGRTREAYAKFLTDLSEPPESETPAPADPDPPSPAADATGPAPETAVAEAGQRLVEADATPAAARAPEAVGTERPVTEAGQELVEAGPSAPAGAATDPAVGAIGAERAGAEARQGLVAPDASDAGARTGRATPQATGPGTPGSAGTDRSSRAAHSADAARPAGSAAPAPADGSAVPAGAAGTPGVPESPGSPALGGAAEATGTARFTEPGCGTDPEPAPADGSAVPAGAARTLAAPDAPGSPAPDGAAAATGTARSTEPGGVADPDAPRTPAQPPAGQAEAAFDALYAHAAPDLIHQAYLLTGRPDLAQEAVERAFRQAWRQWPDVATDPDPVGWVRAVAYEYALSPWHQLRRAHRYPDKPPAEPADRILLDALLTLPVAHRRTVVLYDGVGLDLPDTAAETEASTPTAGGRLLDAHGYLADRVPELADVPPEKQPVLLHDLLSTLTPAVRLAPRPAALVRGRAERRTRLWTRAALGMTSVIAVATAYTAATAPTHYQPPIAPGANVSGVPPLSGPQRITEQSRQLHDKLRADPAAGPARLAPRVE